MNIKCLIGIFIGITLSFVDTVYSDNVRFERIQIGGEGLQASGIGATTSITQDKQGFIWVGGEGGLAKFDGQAFTFYRHNPEDKQTLSHNYIWDLYVDHLGILWVATQKGLNRYNSTLDRFIPFNHGEVGERWSSSTVNCILEDRDGNLLFGTSRGIAVIDKSRKFIRPYFPDTPHEVLSSGHVLSLYEDKNRLLWIGTAGSGLTNFDPISKEINTFQFDDDYTSKISQNIVSDITEDRDGHLWVALLGGGLKRLNDDRQTFSTYRYKPNEKNGITNDTVRKLLVDRYGDLWIATDGGGLARYVEETDNFYNYKFSEYDPYSINTSSVAALYEDRAGDLWAGTFPAGLNFWNRSTSSVDNYYHLGDDLTSISSNPVLSILSDDENSIWVGTESGLNRFNLVNKSFDWFLHVPGDKNSLKANSVLALEKDKFGDIWVGTWSGGLHRYNRENDNFTRFFPDKKNPNSINSEYIWQILSDSKGRLWVATESGGLNRFDYEDSSFRQIKKNKALRENEIEFIWPIFEDSRGRFWVGTEDGVEIFNPDTELFYPFSEVSQQFISDSRISSIYEDSQGYIWFSTYENGVVRYDRDRDDTVRVTAKDGLPTNNITSIIEDDDGNIWLSSLNGVAKINVVTWDVTTYDKGNGLVGNNLNRDATFKDQHGNLYFGTTQGLSVFHPNKIKKNDYIAPVVLTDFRIFHQSAPIANKGSPLTKHISQTQELSLNDKQSAFTIEFSVLNFRAAHKNQYAYKLEGFDNDWNYVGNSRTATYTNLDPGNYKFWVKGSNNEGIWSESTHSVQINVLPPFWRTWWAYTLYVFACASFLFLIFRVHSRKLALERERELNAHLVKVDRLKSDFLANTSHELKTPLNGIIGLAEAMIDHLNDGISDAEIHRNMKTIIQNGRRLSNLVNDVLDFSKLSENKLDLNVVAVDLNVSIKSVIAILKPQIDQSGLKVSVLSYSDIPRVAADAQRLQQILLNLLDNAIKFSDKGEVEVSTENVGDEVRVSVKDEGVGIPIEQQEKIFDFFHQVDGSVTREYGGTGLGLAISSRLVELHGGSLTVESEPEKGSTFTFSLPVATKEMTLSEASPAIDTSTLVDEEGETNAMDEPARILVVDDDPVNRLVLTKILGLNGYSTEEAFDGKHALDIISEEDKFDLLILDIMMPRMSGYELAVRVRMNYSKETLPIVFMSAKDQDEDISAGYYCGGNDYLVKPVSKEDVLESIQELLSLSEACQKEMSE